MMTRRLSVMLPDKLYEDVIKAWKDMTAEMASYETEKEYPLDKCVEEMLYGALRLFSYRDLMAKKLGLLRDQLHEILDLDWESLDPDEYLVHEPVPEK